MWRTAGVSGRKSLGLGSVAGIRGAWVSMTDISVTDIVGREFRVGNSRAGRTRKSSEGQPPGDGRGQAYRMRFIPAWRDVALIPRCRGQVSRALSVPLLL